MSLVISFSKLLEQDVTLMAIITNIKSICAFFSASINQNNPTEQKKSVYISAKSRTACVY